MAPRGGASGTMGDHLPLVNVGYGRYPAVVELSKLDRRSSVVIAGDQAKSCMHIYLLVHMHVCMHAYMVVYNQVTTFLGIT
jgi:hypothetical protein